MNIFKNLNSVIPAQAGIQRFYLTRILFAPASRGSISIAWIPACAGMTSF